ncbi:MAG: sugar-binding transcriptional regulator [Dongiaceae bacterium]
MRVVPGRFNCDPIIQAAWLYYHDNLTQQEIADILGVSRATVINYLNAARDQHVVSVSVKPEAMNTVSLAQELCGQFGLEDALIVPDDGGHGNLIDRIGAAAAHYLGHTCQSDDIIGVAWGRTVLAMSKLIPPTAETDLRVVQIVGSMLLDDGTSAEVCTANIAYRLGAVCVNLHLPALLSSRTLRDALMAEPMVADQFDLIRRCSQVYFGICTLERDSLVYNSGLTTPQSSVTYQEGGAVGVIAGRFYDRTGLPVLAEIDERRIGITLQELKSIPKRIAVAGGAEKVKPILAALVGGYATTLITDEKTARGVLAEAGRIAKLRQAG